MRNSELVEFSGGKFFIDKKHTEEFHRLEEIYMDEDMSDEQPPEWEEAYNRMWEIVNTGIDVSS